MRRSFIPTGNGVFNLTAVLIGVALFGTFASLLPVDMDEFIAYRRAILCGQFPNSAYNTFRLSCSNLDLHLFGYQLPLRSFVYLGSLPGYIYLPIWKMFPFVLSARLLGFVNLLIAASCLTELFRKPIESEKSFFFTFVAILFFFPLTYSLAVDTGPVGMHVSIIALSALLFCRVSSSVLAALFTGIYIAAGLWNKLFFLAGFPALASLVWVGLSLESLSSLEVMKKVLARAKYFLVALMPLLIFVLLMVEAQDANGRSWWQILSSFGGKRELTDIDGHLKHAIHLAKYLTNFAAYSDRVISLEQLSSTFPTTAWWVLAILLRCWVFTYHKATFSRVIIFDITSMFTFALVVLVKNSNLGHHLIYVLLPQIFAFVLILRALPSRRMRYAVLNLHCLLQLFVCYQVITSQPKLAASRTIGLVKEFVDREEISRGNIIVHTSWGSYLYYATFANREQIHLYVDHFSENKLESIQKLAKETERKMLFLGNSTSYGEIEKLRGWLPKFHKVEFKGRLRNSDWSVWTGE